MKIRTVTANEYTALGQLTVDAYERLFDEPLGAYEHQLRDVAGRAADSVVFVGVDDADTLLGGVTYVPGAARAMSEFEDGQAAGIRMLAVDPRHQGNGVGRALMEMCISQARTDGRARIILHSTVYMQVARSLYEHLGFERAADLDVMLTDEPNSEENPFHLIAYVLEL